MTNETLNIVTWIIGFCYTIAVISIISGLLYYRRNGKKAYFFTYVLVAAIVFQLCIMLVRIPIELGFAIGLFAIFGIIRYRTLAINPREMTYLLVAAGLAAKNGLGIDFFEFYKLLISDMFIVLLIVLFELLLFKKKPRVKQMVYKNLELIHEDRRSQLISDLQTSFGLKNIQKVQVGKIDTVKNSAQLRIYFLDEDDQNFSDEEQD